MMKRSRTRTLLRSKTGGLQPPTSPTSENQSGSRPSTSAADEGGGLAGEPSSPGQRRRSTDGAFESTTAEQQGKTRETSAQSRWKQAAGGKLGKKKPGVVNLVAALLDQGANSGISAAERRNVFSHARSFLAERSKDVPAETSTERAGIRSMKAVIAGTKRTHRSSAFVSALKEFSDEQKARRLNAVNEMEELEEHSPMLPYSDMLEEACQTAATLNELSRDVKEKGQVITATSDAINRALGILKQLKDASQCEIKSLREVRELSESRGLSKSILVGLASDIAAMREALRSQAASQGRSDAQAPEETSKLDMQKYMSTLDAGIRRLTEIGDDHFQQLHDQAMDQDLPEECPQDQEEEEHGETEAGDIRAESSEEAEACEDPQAEAEGALETAECHGIPLPEETATEETAAEPEQPHEPGSRVAEAFEDDARICDRTAPEVAPGEAEQVSLEQMIPEASAIAYDAEPKAPQALLQSAMMPKADLPASAGFSEREVRSARGSGRVKLPKLSPRARSEPDNFDWRMESLSREELALLNLVIDEGPSLQYSSSSHSVTHDPARERLWKKVFGVDELPRAVKKAAGASSSHLALSPSESPRERSHRRPKTATLAALVALPEPLSPFHSPPSSSRSFPSQPTELLLPTFHPSPPASPRKGPLWHFERRRVGL
eukprot:TRINITY_DN5631_c0_g1_i1.p1 TRINITY_DN5631_c0_g1~~TRINITY_DN5631_c0_g1_i1.p1  ORF type:complete len:666 (+),score=143.75 TRINITY_DN5631_c0_g1_i1:99-2096(+)